MKFVRLSLFSLAIFTFSACKDNTNTGNDQGASTPIDSTNVKGTAPATYGGNNPANDQSDTNKGNANDTATKPNNIHNEGTYK